MTPQNISTHCKKVVRVKNYTTYKTVHSPCKKVVRLKHTRQYTLLYVILEHKGNSISHKTFLKGFHQIDINFTCYNVRYVNKIYVRAFFFLYPILRKVGIILYLCKWFFLE
uniref:Uncharacterized protein n=1 Tax=Cacopsylla melanoneura TaxID=428564 RepID=A0A8D9B9W3_9HEMI